MTVGLKKPQPDSVALPLAWAIVNLASRLLNRSVRPVARAEP